MGTTIGRSVSVVTALLSLSLPASGQRRSSADAVERALAYATLRHELQAAATDAERLRVLEELVAHHPADGRLWRDLARSRLGDGRVADAAEALRRAIDLGAIGAAEGACEVARVLANADPSQAATALARCLERGYRFRDALGRDPSLASVRTIEPARTVFTLPSGAVCEGVSGWRHDLTYLLGELERVHYSLRRTGVPAAMRAQAETLRADLPALSDAEIVVRLQRIVASLEDGHTVLYPLGMARGALARLPLGLWLFDDGLFVVRADDEHTELVRSRVLEMGGRTVADLLAGLTAYTSNDNPSGFRWVAPVYLTFVEFLEAVGADPAAGLLLQGPDGQTRRYVVEPTRTPVAPDALVLSLPPPAGVAPPRYLRDAGDPFGATALSDGVYYVQVNRVANGRDETLAAFGRRVRSELDANAARAVVLDLRHNAGGEAGLLPELVRTVVAFSADPERQVYVLTSRNTFSAAQTLINLVEALTDAVFVGEPSGTRPNRPGNEAPLRLPCSGVLGAISSGFNQGLSARDERLWIPPDVPVGLTSADYFAGRDPVLETVLALVRSR